MITARELRAALQDLAWEVYEFDPHVASLQPSTSTDQTGEVVEVYVRRLASYRRLWEMLSDLEHAELHASLGSGRERA